MKDTAIKNPIEIDLEIRSIIKKIVLIYKYAKMTILVLKLLERYRLCNVYKKVDDFYFANTIPKEKDCRLCFSLYVQYCQHFILI